MRLGNQSLDTSPKLNNSPSATKYRLFESAVDYILTYNQEDLNLLHEILGLSHTSCQAFDQYTRPPKVLFSSCFSPSLTRETTYFIIICYLRNLQRNNELNNTKIISNSIKEWFKNLMESSAYDIEVGMFIKGVDLYSNEILVKEGKISFNCNHYMKHITIKLKKLTSYYKDNVIRYTKKADNIYNNCVDANEEGYCLGLVKYFLEERFRIDDYDLKNNKRPTERQIFADSMSKANIINIKIRVQNSARTGVHHDFILDNHQIADIYTKTSEFSTKLKDICSIMQKSNLNLTYALILTSSHALGLSVVKKGTGFKLVFYNPNDKKLHARNFIHQSNLNDLEISHGFTTYFEDKTTTQLLIKLYAVTNKSGQSPCLSNIRKIPDANDIDIARQLILIGIANFDAELIKSVLQQYKDDVSIVVESGKESTIPLHASIAMSIQHNSTTILDLFVSHIITACKNNFESNGQHIKYLKTLDNKRRTILDIAEPISIYPGKNTIVNYLKTKLVCNH